MTAPKENRYEGRDARGLLSAAGLGLLFVVTAFFRFYDLGLKPPHFDEGINGHFVLTIWRDGFYSYDPTNFHGPLYFYLCHLAEVIFGRGVESFRLMNAALATAVVGVVVLFRPFVGRAALIAAWVFAVSPAFTFYGRYAIHETLFMLAQIIFVYGRFTWMNRPSGRALAWMAVGVVLLVATKETFFIFLGTWVIAEAVIWFLEKMERSGHPWTPWALLSAAEKRSLRFEGLAIVGLSILVLAALFSGFFERTQGLVDFFRAFNVWSATGTKGNGHEKPFFYWLQVMSRYEWPLIVGFIVAAYATLVLRFEHRKQRILLLSGFGLVLAYSLIPYKTPWLLLGFWPLGFFALPRGEMPKLKLWTPAVLVGGLILGLNSVYWSWRLNFVDYANAQEPYVYVQTTTDYSNVMNVLRKKLARNPEARNFSIIVMVQDPWPLPYDLSLFPKMRYARVEDIGVDSQIVRDADVMLIDGAMLQGLRQILPKRFARMKFQLRDAYGSGWALFDVDNFESVLPDGVEIEEPAGKEAK